VSCFLARNYLKIAIRYIFRQRWYALTNVIGLAIGLAVCLLIFIWMQHEFSFGNNIADARNIYRIVRFRPYAEKTVNDVFISASLVPALQQKIPEVTTARFGRFVGDVLVNHGDCAYYEEHGAYVDSSFFELFSLKFLSGGEPGFFQERLSVILTQSFAQQYFGAADPLGQILTVEGFINLKVTGIVSDLPANFHLKIDFFVPFDLYKNWGANFTRWDAFTSFCYLRLPANLNIKTVEQKINHYTAQFVTDSGDYFYLQPLQQIHLHTRKSNDPWSDLGDIDLVRIFGSIAVFILVIACINFINLSTAQAATHTREIGVRKALGAHRYQLILNFLGETLILTVFATFLALSLIEVVLHHFNHLTGQTLKMHYHNPHFLLILMATVLSAGVLSGSYPALFLSGIQPARVLRNKLVERLPIRFNLTIRQCLVVFQFTLSLILIISILVIKDQLQFIRMKNLGFDANQVILIQNRPGMYQGYPEFKMALLKHPQIKSVSAADGLMDGVTHFTEILEWPNKKDTLNEAFVSMLVSYDFFKLFDISIIQGRSFSPDDGEASSKQFLINQSAAHLLGFDNPLGQRIHYQDTYADIIGIVEDYHHSSLHKSIKPMFFLHSEFPMTYIFVKISGKQLHETLKFIEAEWNKIVPNFPFKFRFLDETIHQFYLREQLLATLILYFTILTIFISCLGLLGLAALTTQQRTKEIGIRKALGASTTQITLILSFELTKWILFANLIAWPVSAFFMHRWLAGFAYHTSIRIFNFFFAALLVLVIALITVAIQSIRAARANPVSSLRYE
jgi:putative ABC transport system permease protein